VIEEEEELLPEISDFDPQPALATLENYRAHLELLLEQAKEIKVIRDEVTHNRALEMAAQAKKLFKRLEDTRHHFVDPHHEYKSTVDRFVKSFTDPLKDIQRYLAQLSGNYRAFLETERRRLQAEQEAERVKLEAAQRKEADEQAEKGVFYEPTPVPAPVVPDVRKSFTTPSGRASHREDWDFEIVDESLLERQFLSPDLKKIREAVKKGGLRESPGLRIFNRFVTQIRT
jgi:hypothetical protein